MSVIQLYWLSKTSSGYSINKVAIETESYFNTTVVNAEADPQFVRWVWNPYTKADIGPILKNKK